ncbi:MAG: FAD-dependent oxidoreductase, partial [Cyclobacteriaceae bacterium]|nr:FAD-dependent oxidoreductase [Cyclobacteriaceae bacterium]
ETALGAKLLYPLPMLRPLVSVKEQNLWGTKIHDPAFNTYIESIFTSGEMPEDVRSEFGGLMLKRCGYVDTTMLIKATANMLDNKTSLVKERFEIKELLIEGDSVSYRGRTARKIIFCEGPNLSHNQYFNWLPLRPVKGETLLVELSRPLPYILNRGVFVLPVFENTAVVGATFEHRELNWNSSDKGRDELEHKLRTLTSIPYKVVAQKAGIRPATQDRRPFIGIHPRYEPLGVFNGLGTKGVSLAPYFAHEFSEFLELGTPLTNEVTISRYFILYYD